LALTPTSDDTLVREVDEELRRDELVKLWRRWGRVAIGVIVVALLAFAGVLWWRSHNAAQAEATGEKLNGALQDAEQGKPADATKALAEIATSKQGGYRGSAQLAEGDMLLEKNDTKGAVAKYAAVAADSGVPQPMRDAAVVRQTMAEFDSLKPEVVIQRLGPMAVKGTPWFGTTGEMVAIANLRLGKRDVAVRTLRDVVADPDVPESLRARAVHLADALSAVPAKQAEEKKTQ
jgi:hypothetical protein